MGVPAGFIIFQILSEFFFELIKFFATKDLSLPLKYIIYKKMKLGLYMTF